jgi:hypothetical protein
VRSSLSASRRNLSISYQTKSLLSLIGLSS